MDGGNQPQTRLGLFVWQRQRLNMEKGVEWGMGRQRVGQTAKSYRICMEFVWNLYGVCMEQHARNTQSTPSQRACNRRARRQAAQAGVVGSPTELAGTTPRGAEEGLSAESRRAAGCR